MTEQEAKALAAELDSHRYWRVKKVCFNSDPYDEIVFVEGKSQPVYVPRQPGWEVHLEHRTWPECGSGHLFQDWPLEYPQETIAALNEGGAQLEQWHAEWLTRKWQKQGM